MKAADDAETTCLTCPVRGTEQREISWAPSSRCGEEKPMLKPDSSSSSHVKGRTTPLNSLFLHCWSLEISQT